MAGHVIVASLREQGFDVTALAGSKKLNPDTILLDLTNKELFDEFLNSNEFDVIVNSVGILIEQSEARKDLSTYLNSFLPHYLEYKYIATKTKIIHLSTDCVFSGKNAPYREDAQYDGELFYDKTKALGEIINDKDLTLRMSIIGPDINPDGVGLFNWFQKQSGTIFGYKNVVWNGVTTIELARGIAAAIKQDTSGLYHFVPAHNISKFDLLNLLKEAFQRQDLQIDQKDTNPSDKTLINTRNDFNYTVPDYPEMIHNMKTWIDSHPNMYPHYDS